MKVELIWLIHICSEVNFFNFIETKINHDTNSLHEFFKPKPKVYLLELLVKILTILQDIEIKHYFRKSEYTLNFLYFAL